MSANNVVWVMNHITWDGNWHVFYSGCVDNIPEKPDYKAKYYKVFQSRAGAILYAHDVVGKIDEFSLQEGYVGVEYGVMEVKHYKSMVETIGRIKPTLDALYIASKTVTNKDIQDFVDLVENMVGDLQQELISKENRIKERLCVLEDNFNLLNIKHKIHYHEGKELKDKPAKRKDGCYQFTYCNECLAYPMGLGCPNLVKGPVQLKKLSGEKTVGGNTAPSIPLKSSLGEPQFKTDSKPPRSCDGCDDLGQCDHQGAYQKDGKWCYET